MLPHVTCLKDYAVLWLEAPHGNSPAAMFSGNWPSANGDITYLICHMTLIDHVIEGSCDFIDESFMAGSADIAVVEI